MSRRSLLDMIEITARVPRGEAGFWKIIKEFDAKGPWSLTDIDQESNVARSTVRDFVRKLVAGGYATSVTETGGTRKLFRLVKSPVEAPSLRRDGTERPEPIGQMIWRTIRMAKSFTCPELCELATADGKPANYWTVKSYLKHLSRAGIVVCLDPQRAHRSARYRLAIDVGPRAPKVLRTHVVFDPNGNKVFGDSETVEVKP